MIKDSYISFLCLDSIDFGYSVKNIPLPRKESYIYKHIDKTEQLLKRMRWKALFYDNDNTSHRKKNQSENKNNCFTMKSRKCPPQQKVLKVLKKI